MLFETIQPLKLPVERSVSTAPDPTLPPGVALAERAAAALRAYLQANDLAHYEIFYCCAFDFDDIDDHLARLGEAAARWEAPPPLTDGGEAMGAMTHESEGARLWRVGFLRLRRHDVVILRRYFLGDEQYRFYSLHLCAAPSAEHYARLRSKVVNHRRAHGEAVWQVLRGSAWRGTRRIRRDADPGDELLLADEIRQRIEADILSFFTDEVAALYRSLKVPYRRGVLLHGPPGNGKTSIIRLIGALLPQVPAMILRTSEGFDSDDLEGVIRRWTQQAPAILVIEDLNWLLAKLNVSTFLNQLDGIESPAKGGLMLIATTNHPDQLDPAINNRPGRFDVVLEIRPPDRAQRRRFLRAKVEADVADATIDHAADVTADLSFAHLHELLRHSGLLAIHAGRSRRSDADVRRAAEVVAETQRHADRGFPRAPEAPFGLARRRASANRESAAPASPSPSGRGPG
jgi:MoxR-like ATPase